MYFIHYASKLQGACKCLITMAYMNNTPLCFSILILMLVPKSGAKVPAIIVFGDSSVDSGNNNFIPTIARSNFEPYGRDFPGGNPTGRFCNGRLPPDFISEAFGLKSTIPAFLDPSFNVSDFAVGVCFASAATGMDNITAQLLGVIPLWKQVEYFKDYQSKLRAYLGQGKANLVISEALYLVSVGTNDFLENYYVLPDRKSQLTVQEYEDFLLGLTENFITQLYYLGARKFSMTGLPPMGCLPSQRSTNFLDPGKCVEDYNIVAMDFNVRLKASVDKLNKNLHGIRIAFSNPYHIFLQIIKKPSLYGMEVADVACCGTGTFEAGLLCSLDDKFTCTDADKYVFWDAIHPTQKTNRIISSI